jgi:SAM-dependent methyltransferase
VTEIAAPLKSVERAQRYADSSSWTSLAACPVCDSTLRRWRAKRTANGTFTIDRCRGCGFAFVNPRPPLDYLQSYYSSIGHPLAGGSGVSAKSVLDEERTFPNATLDAERMTAVVERRLGRVVHPRRLLDVGCGYGFFARAARMRGFEVVAIELARVEREIAHTIAQITPLDILFEDAELEPNSFTAVLMSQTLEHALNVNLWIAKARALLRPGGVLAIALPNFGSLSRRLLQQDEPYITPPEHLNYFDAASLTRLVRKHGLTSVELEWVSRVRPGAIARRLPWLGGAAAATIERAVCASFGLVDRMQLGIMLRLYAQKPVLP